MPLKTNQNPYVSVIIPCRNEAGYIGECVEHILAQKTRLSVEVIIADGMSDDGTREILEALQKVTPRIVIKSNPCKIVSTGLNIAIAAARGEIVIRMDAHTKYAPDYIENCVSVLIKSNADCVGGPWIAQGMDYKSDAVAAAFQSPLVIGGARGHDPVYEGPVDTVYLGCWRKSTLEKVGLFDEEFVRNQDDELSLRINRRDGKIWQSSSIRSVYHPRNSLSALFRQ